MKRSCGLLKTKPKTKQKQLSGSASNQLFTAKGKYHLFFTLSRKKKIYLFKTVPSNLLFRETLPLIAKPPPPPGQLQPGAPVPVNSDFFSMLLAGLTHHLKSKQTDKGLDCSRSRVSGCWELGRRCSFSLHLFAVGAAMLREERRWAKSILPWPEEQTLCIWFTWYRPSWKKKTGQLQMDLVSTEISTPKDRDGENAVKP